MTASHFGAWSSGHDALFVLRHSIDRFPSATDEPILGCIETATKLNHACTTLTAGNCKGSTGLPTLPPALVFSISTIWAA